MRAIRIAETGGPEVLTLTEVDTPEPGPGLVLVKLAASGINFIDTYHRSGAYPMKLPLILGSEGSGEVVKVGEGVTDVHVGDRVASTNFTGAYAEYALAPADRTVPVPDGLDLELAAAVLLQGMTAHYLLFDSYRVQSGDPVLVHAGAGGMGLLLTQLAAELGATVITTASTPEKAKLSSEAGAAHVLSYDDVPDKVKELTGGAGVAAAYDGVGRTTFEGSLASLRPRASLVLYGYASGRPDPFDINRLQAGSYKLTRPTLGHFVVTRPELLERAEYVLQRVADGRLIVRIGHRYPLAEAAQAHRDLEGRKTTGKILLNP